MVTSTKPFTPTAELSRNRCHPTLTAKHLTKNGARLLAINWNLLICRKHVTNLFKTVNSICPVPHLLTDQRVKFPLQKEWTGRRSTFLSHTSFSVWLNNAERLCSALFSWAHEALCWDAGRHAVPAPLPASEYQHMLDGVISTWGQDMRLWARALFWFVGT